MRDGKSPRREADKSNMTCWLCGKPGHFYKNCRQGNAMPFQTKMQIKAMKEFLSDVEHFTPSNE